MHEYNETAEKTLLFRLARRAVPLLCAAAVVALICIAWDSAFSVQYASPF